jgi:hypothetical protein
MSRDVIVNGALGVLIALTAMNSCNSCNHSTQESKTAKAIRAMDSTINQRPTFGQVDTIIRREGLRISKRSLYGQNAVLRTAARPDDLMNQYDAEIDSLSR